MRRTSGFTLIEMMIVIAIIAILSGIVLVGVTGYQATARDAKRATQLRSVQNLVELYYAQCGFYPGAASCADKNAVITWDGLKSALSLSAGDAAKFPNTPDGTAKWGFKSCGNAQQYTVAVQFEKGNAAATEDSAPSCQPDGFICTGANGGTTFCLSE
jgi:prepilin-type N-terminal cleavage/methylation domain-containing protein